MQKAIRLMLYQVLFIEWIRFLGIQLSLMDKEV